MNLRPLLKWKSILIVGIQLIYFQSNYVIFKFFEKFEISKNSSIFALNSLNYKKKIKFNIKNKINLYLYDLNHANIEIKRLAANKLGNFKNIKVVNELIKILKTKDYELQLNAKRSLIKLNKIALDNIIKSLNNKNDIIRQQCVIILGKIKSKKAILTLRKTLINDNNAKVRAYSATALGEIKDDSSLKYLIKALNDKNWQVRANIIKTFGKIKNLETINILINFLNKPNSYIRMYSAISLGKIKNLKSVPNLIQQLRKDNNPKVRKSCIWALGKIGDKKAFKILLYSLVKDSNSLVRQEAQEALINMGYKNSQIKKYMKIH